tara:strand:- start:586 stop:807 length:222 start_codon:yes stop_codon:yes gene_type:complete
MKVFKDLGYFVEYCVDGKLIGTLLIDNPDREDIGYYSRIDAIADSDIKLQRNKIIKKGTKYYTRLYPLCGQKI